MIKTIIIKDDGLSLKTSIKTLTRARTRASTKSDSDITTESSKLIRLELFNIIQSCQAFCNFSCR